jgi:hypothetical protein
MNSACASNAALARKPTNATTLAERPIPSHLCNGRADDVAPLMLEL